jgi:GAF domain-containing protein
VVLARPVLKDPALQQATVSRLTHLARGGPDEAEILDEAVRSVAEALDVEMAAYAELAPGQEVFVLRAAVGWPQSRVGVATIPAGGRRSHAGFVVAEGRPVPVPDFRAETRFTPSPLLTENEVVSGIGVVVYAHQGQALGVLGGQSRTFRDFSDEDGAFLQTIADVVSVGLLRRRSEERFRKLVQKSSDLITVVSDRAELLYASPAAERMLGFVPAHIGREMFPLVHPEDRSARPATS